jgi:carboxylate-amine ligase
LLSWTAPVRGELGIEVALPELNGAQRQRRLLESGASIEDVYAATVRESRETYAQEAIV